MNPYTDFGFKRLFGTEANKDLLIDFLNQILPPAHNIIELSFKNPENLSELPFLRKSIFGLPRQRQSWRLSLISGAIF